MNPAKSGATKVVVVDGSNIATEGRSTPSLRQLNDAVLAFINEFPDATVTVVVDATFGHRIDKRESGEFEAAVANNELVAPPAGAIGRGDAFVLNIANKVGARILSNDSFQEFHGTYPWLFDEGRLIGGKPVPNVGWVFVERLPVKGPVSRKAQRAARTGPSSKVATEGTTRSRRSASAEASQPMPVPTSPPPGARRKARNTELLAVSPDAVRAEAVAAAAPSTAGAAHAVNELLPFLDFVEHHPIGSSVNGVVESYSSHGAYVSVDSVRGYVPLRLMADPAPRSAREMMKIGDAVTLVVTSFAPGRRSVDLAVPEMALVAPVEHGPARAAAEPAPAAKKTAKKAVPGAPAKKAAAVAKEVAPAGPPADVEPEVPADEVPAKKAPAKKVPAAKKAPAKKAPAAKKAAAKKTAAKKAAVAKKAPAKKATPVNKAPAAKKASNAAAG
jgi:hypothetical protein